jgi:hypothetical protein
LGGEATGKTNETHNEGVMMRRIARPWFLIVVILSAAVAVVIATAMSQKQRLQLMDAAERREYLGSKLETRISNEQIDRIAAAVSARLDGAAFDSESDDQANSESEDTAEPAGDS